MSAMGVLRHGKRLRGTPLDPFGRTEERRQERALIVQFEKLIDEMLNLLTPENHDTAVELAKVPMNIRGYGPVKEANIEKANAQQAELLARLRGQEQFKTVAVIRPAS